MSNTTHKSFESEGLELITSINQQFKNILETDLIENYQMNMDYSKLSLLFNEIDNLSHLVETKRPELDEMEKLQILDELFYTKVHLENLRIDDKIQETKSLIESQRHMVDSDMAEDLFSVHNLENQLEELKSKKLF